MMIQRHWMWFICLFLLLFSFEVRANKAILLHIDGAIGPATQDYVGRGIDYARDQHANLIILKLDTPGGLESSMRGINQAIIASPIPVIAFVTPAGARAASAGVYMMYASHLAVMANGTNIGAASPINLFDASQSNDLTIEEKKALNDASAYIRSLAQLRGRNADWGQLAVLKSASISATEAKQLNVINNIANNDSELLQQINGQTVNLSGVSQKINTDHLQIQELNPDWRYQFLQFITNPNIAYLLLLLAIYGIFFELVHPGLILPGVAGVIALIIVLFAFQMMPINFAGLTLLLIGIAFMIFEVYVSSFGIVGFGGIIAFILGSILLLDINDDNYRLAWTLIIVMSIITISFFFMIANLVLRAHKRAIVTGREGLIGTEGIVLSADLDKTLVRVLGEMWDAESSAPLTVGQKITVTDVHGLVLTVAPIKIKRQPKGDL